MDAHDRLTQAERAWGDALASRPAGGCPEAADLLRLAQGRAGAARARLLDHLAGCPGCRAEHRHLVALERARPAWLQDLLPRVGGWRGAGLTAAAAAALFVGFVMTRDPIVPVAPSDLTAGQTTAEKSGPRVAAAPAEPAQGNVGPGGASPRPHDGKVLAPAAPSTDSADAGPPLSKPLVAPPRATGPTGPAKARYAREDGRRAAAPAVTGEPARGRGSLADATVPSGAAAPEERAAGAGTDALGGVAERIIANRDGVWVENGVAVSVISGAELARAAAELDGDRPASLGLSAADRASPGEAQFAGGFGGGGYGAPAAQAGRDGGVQGGRGGLGGGARAGAPTGPGGPGGQVTQFRSDAGANQSQNAAQKAVGGGRATQRRGVPQGGARQALTIAPDPANAGLLDDRPVFRVEAGPGEPAPDLSLYLMDPAANAQRSVELKTSTGSGGQSALGRPAQPLDARRSYDLYVDRGQAKSGLNLGAPERFNYRVLDARERDRVRWALSNQQEAPMTSALVLYSVGRYADALGALKAAPDEARVRVWRANLSRMVAERRQQAVDVGVSVQRAPAGAAGGQARPPGRR